MAGTLLIHCRHEMPAMDAWIRKSGKRIWEGPFYGRDEMADGSVFRYTVSPVLTTFPRMRTGCATSLRKDSLGRGFRSRPVSRRMAGEPLKSFVAKIGGMPPLMQRTAQSRWTLPLPGFITPR